MEHFQLRIADIVFDIISASAYLKEGDSNGGIAIKRFRQFFCSDKTPDIKIKVFPVRALPAISGKTIFVRKNLEGKEAWRLLGIKGGYEFSGIRGSQGNCRYLMRINGSFDRVDAFVLSSDGRTWELDDLHEFLLVLIIHYLASRDSGVVLHAAAVEDINGDGLVFAGCSGAGKSTSSRLWLTHTKAKILNDDRVIVRKLGKTYVMYGSPWFGFFEARPGRVGVKAGLKSIFFIKHGRTNKAERVELPKSFIEMYRRLFAPFWDARLTGSTVRFCQAMLSSVSCFSLDFTKDKAVIACVRKKLASLK